MVPDTDQSDCLDDDIGAPRKSASVQNNLGSEPLTWNPKSTGNVLPKDASEQRAFAHSICEGWPFKTFMSIIIFSNTIAVIIETDARAFCKRADFSGAACPADAIWLKVMNLAFLAIYTAEMGFRMFIYRSEYFKSSPDLFDAFIVFTGYLGEIMGGFSATGILRLFRVLRLFRAARVAAVSEELAIIINGLAGALRAICMGSILIFALITLWSIIAVELLDGPNQLIADTDYYEIVGCERCRRAYESVMDANLTFLQTVLHGDSWGVHAVPIIEAEPLTAVLFVGCSFSVGLGLTNLILAVIVDKALQVRNDDLACRLLAKEHDQDEARERLMLLCKRMDNDGSGCLSLDELKHGYDTLEEFAGTLKIMEITKDDLDAVFRIMDKDNSGFLSYSEFCTELSRLLKSQDINTMIALIKYYVLDVGERLKSLEKILAEAPQSSTSPSISLRGLQQEGSYLERPTPAEHSAGFPRRADEFVPTLAPSCMPHPEAPRSLPSTDALSRFERQLNSQMQDLRARITEQVAQLQLGAVFETDRQAAMLLAAFAELAPFAPPLPNTAVPLAFVPATPAAPTTAPRVVALAATEEAAGAGLQVGEAPSALLSSEPGAGSQLAERAPKRRPQRTALSEADAREEHRTNQQARIRR